MLKSVIATTRGRLQSNKRWVDAFVCTKCVSLKHIWLAMCFLCSHTHKEAYTHWHLPMRAQVVGVLIGIGGMAGLVGRVVSRAPKYSLFDPAKEMVSETKHEDEEGNMHRK